jgi:formyltetrahydrofolate deformylase
MGDMNSPERGRLRIVCKDQSGIVAVVSQFLYEQGANIVQSDQYSLDPEGGMFFMRIEFDMERLAAQWDTLQHQFMPIAQRFGMHVQFTQATVPKRMAIFVSKEEHCLLELLWLWKAGDFDAHIAVVVSNHPDMQSLVSPLGIPFVHIPVTPQTKADAEQAQIDVLAQHHIDLVVLARYMQILSPQLIEPYKNRIINIHHSFLPAFVGGNPYKQAYARGVKIIGATAHYVTEQLDAGPIIEQDVQRVTHRDTHSALKRMGRMIERTVLARAVQWHVEDRLLVYENKTVVFR